MFLLYLAIGIGLVLVLHWGLRAYSQASPETIRKLGKYVSIGGALALIAILFRLGAGKIGSIISGLLLFGPVLEKYLRAASYPPPGTPRKNKAMSAEEARAVLGVGVAATEEEIREAHKRLMQKNHPDQGGSDYLASKINQARDVLLKET